MLRDLGVRHALLLQGPVGPFFSRLAAELRDQGARVTKVNFNPGDSLFYRGDDALCFREPLERWPEYLARLLDERAIDSVFLFGDCRPIHKAAMPIVQQRGLPVWVFEEGYLRPDHITMELGGVNGNSSMPKDPEFYRRAAAALPELEPPLPVGATFGRHATFAALNALGLTLFGWRYPAYRHHRDVNAFWQAACWVRGLYRKLAYGVRERGIVERCQGEWTKRYFLVPLQVHCDAQLEHSPYGDMREFIDEVVASFAGHAPADCKLVVKHHPQDRPYRDYAGFLRELGERYGCAERLVYVHDLHLPTLLKHARGVITMNSTVGTSALYHRAPLKVMGTAVYDVPGMTHQGSLADFFRDPGAVDDELFRCFCRWLRETNQINGSFYRRTPGISTASGLSSRSLATLAAGASLPEPRREIA